VDACSHVRVILSIRLFFSASLFLSKSGAGLVMPVSGSNNSMKWKRHTKHNINKNSLFVKLRSRDGGIDIGKVVMKLTEEGVKRITDLPSSVSVDLSKAVQ